MGLFDLLKEETKVEEPQKEEIKEAEVVEKETAVKEPEKEVKEEPKKEVKKKAKTSKTKAKAQAEKTERKYKYPFQLYSNDHYYETDHIFEEGKEYTFKEIAKAMLEHKKYEFDGELVEAYIEEDNVLTFTQKQYKKG